MIHIILHFVIPVLVALALYRERWRWVTLILIGTMLVDLDHLLADPIYDPGRCSIGHHPLHTMPAIMIYMLLFLFPFLQRLVNKSKEQHPAVDTLHLVGLGLVIHMTLDWIDCLL